MIVVILVPRKPRNIFSLVGLLRFFIPNFIGNYHDIQVSVNADEYLSAVNLPNHLILLKVVEVDRWVVACFV